MKSKGGGGGFWRIHTWVLYNTKHLPSWACHFFMAAGLAWRRAKVDCKAQERTYELWSLSGSSCSPNNHFLALRTIILFNIVWFSSPSVGSISSLPVGQQPACQGDLEWPHIQGGSKIGMWEPACRLRWQSADSGANRMRQSAYKLWRTVTLLRACSDTNNEML